jgi:hypothetical protein
MGTRICSVAVIAYVATGCAGGSAESTSTPTTTAPTKPAPTKHQVVSDTLWKFLDAVKPIRARSIRLGAQANVWVDKIVNVCCTDWAETATATRRAANGEKHAADELAAIAAPAALEHVYLAYVDSYRGLGLADAGFASQLESHEGFTWSTFKSQWSTHEAPVTRFRIALIEYAAVNHLSLPRWVHTIGGN